MNKQATYVNEAATSRFIITINETCSQLFKGDYHRTDKREVSCKSLDEVRAYLAKYYEGKKRVRMYIDHPDALKLDVNKLPLHVGYIYSFRNSDGSNGCWNQQDWVSVVERIETPVVL